MKWSDVQSSAADLPFSEVSDGPPPAKRIRCSNTEEKTDRDGSIDNLKVGELSEFYNSQLYLVGSIILGLMNIPLANLSKPPEDSRLLRKPDPTFIKNLKANMMKDPVAPGASPMAVLCREVSRPSQFQEKYKNVYRYEVLGGLHTYMAKLQLIQEIPDIPHFKDVNAEVYVGLSDEQALRLSQRHNQNSHFTHAITHRDLVCDDV